MKRLSFLILALVGAIMFFGCEKEEVIDSGSEPEAITPELTLEDLEDAYLKCATKAVVRFTGTSVPVLPGDPGEVTVLPNGKTLITGFTAEWYEQASAWQVTGRSMWVANYLWDGIPLQSKGKMWGTCEIFVEGDRGKWVMKWRGKFTPNPDGSFTIKAVAFGKGIEGDVKRHKAKWLYTFNFAEDRYDTEGMIKIPR